MKKKSRYLLAPNHISNHDFELPLIVTDENELTHEVSSITARKYLRLRNFWSFSLKKSAQKNMITNTYIYTYENIIHDFSQMF